MPCLIGLMGKCAEHLPEFVTRFYQLLYAMHIFQDPIPLSLNFVFTWERSPPGSNRVKVPPFSPGLAEDAGEAGLLWGFKEGGDQISLQWLKLSFYSFRFVSFRADYATQFFMVFLYKMQYQEKVREKWQFTAPQLFWSMGSIANLLARANIKHTLGRKK